MNSKKMPALFIGHGSPMNAVETNSFTRQLNRLGQTIESQWQQPKAILCISAHWLTAGTWVTHSKNPQQIYDFYGFPQKLFDFKYPVMGSLELAEQIQNEIKDPLIHFDDQQKQNQWGIDHGTWSVLAHLYPKADIPVVQLSIDMSEPPSFHFEMGERLRFLREQGVLILGSGNIVHNLRKINFSPDAIPFDWAVEFDEWTKLQIEKKNFKALQNDFLRTESGKLSVPTLDHYLPLLYVLGASRSDDVLSFEYEEMVYSSLSMRCVGVGVRE